MNFSCELVSNKARLAVIAFVIREMQITVTVRYLYVPTKISAIIIVIMG